MCGTAKVLRSGKRRIAHAMRSAPFVWHELERRAYLLKRREPRGCAIRPAGAPLRSRNPWRDRPDTDVERRKVLLPATRSCGAVATIIWEAGKNVQRRFRNQTELVRLSPHRLSRTKQKARSMRASVIFAVFVLTLLGVCAPASAKGCLKGAIVGGAAGHYAGHHGALGAAAGCIIGRHYAHKRARAHRPAGEESF